jgi:hypothetical protein
MSRSVYTGLSQFNFIRKHFLQIFCWDVSYVHIYHRSLSAQRLSERTVFCIILKTDSNYFLDPEGVFGEAGTKTSVKLEKNYSGSHIDQFPTRDQIEVLKKGDKWQINCEIWITRRGVPKKQFLWDLLERIME